MHIHQKQTYQTQILAKAFLVLMLVYLCFHLFLSERSIPAYFKMTHAQNILQTEVGALTVKRDALQDRVVRLRPETLDMDLVEDYTLRMLGRGMSGSIMLVE